MEIIDFLIGILLEYVLQTSDLRKQYRGSVASTWEVFHPWRIVLLDVI